MNWNLILNVLLWILLIAAMNLGLLYYFGRKLEKKQAASQSMMEAAKQIVSILVIDKKKLKIKESGLPKMVYEQTPKYMRWAKLPIVKAKVGPKIVTLIADEKVFQVLPVKSEAKVVISGLYITELKSVRGKSIQAAPKKSLKDKLMFWKKDK